MRFKLLALALLSCAAANAWQPTEEWHLDADPAQIGPACWEDLASRDRVDWLYHTLGNCCARARPDEREGCNPDPKFSVTWAD